MSTPDHSAPLTTERVHHWLQLCRDLNAAKDPQAIIDVVLDSLRMDDIHECSLLFIDIDAKGQPEWVWTVAGWRQDGNDSPLIGQRFYLPDFAISKLWVSSPDKPLLIGSIADHPSMDPHTRQIFEASGTAATVLAPLVQAGRWVGIFSMSWTHPRTFTEEEGQLFSTVQVLAAASVENLRLLDDKNRALDDLRQKLETIERQAQAIQELSTPVIEIWDDVLVMPVVGIVDTRRSKDIMDSLLHRVVETQSKCAIIDVTGVEIVDTMTADYLLKVVRASRLLGARCVLTGLTPAVAQTLIETGADMSEVPTLRNLKEGLRDCLRFLHARKG